MAKLPDTPEGLGIDSKGNIYTTLFHTGEVLMLKDDGTYDHIAWGSRQIALRANAARLPESKRRKRSELARRALEQSTSYGCDDVAEGDEP